MGTIFINPFTTSAGVASVLLTSLSQHLGPLSVTVICAASTKRYLPPGVRGLRKLRLKQSVQHKGGTIRAVNDKSRSLDKDYQ